MKKIECYIQPYNLDMVAEALAVEGVVGMSVAEVKGFGVQRGFTRGEEVQPGQYRFHPKMKVEMVVPDERRGAHRRGHRRLPSRATRSVRARSSSCRSTRPCARAPTSAARTPSSSAPAVHRDEPQGRPEAGARGGPAPRPSVHLPRAARLHWRPLRPARTRARGRPWAARPMTFLAGSPSLNRMIVGMLMMPNLLAMAGFSSTLTLPTVTLSACSLGDLAR